METKTPLTLVEKAQARIDTDLENYKINRTIDLLNNQSRLNKQLLDIAAALKNVEALTELPNCFTSCSNSANEYAVARNY